MKKQILLIASIALSTLAIAQVKPSFGIRAGVSSSGMRGDAAGNIKNIAGFTNGIINTSQRTGFFAGTYAAIPFNNLISVEPALYYSQKGYGLKGDYTVKNAGFLGANAKARLNTQYIDLPVVIKATISGFQLFAGPQISYLIHADLHTTAGALGINLLNAKTNATQQFNRWNEGVTAGIGYQFTNGINVMAAYDYGLSKADANKNIQAYSQSFKAGIGVKF